MSAKRIVARVGSYTNREGQEKGEYVEIGVILQGDKGEFALLDPSVNLAGVLTKQNMHAVEQKKAGDTKARTGTSVMCGIYERDQQNAHTTAPASDNGDQFGDDDIPF